MKKEYLKNNQTSIPLMLWLAFFILNIPHGFAQQMWSNPATWGGTKPVAGEAVTIPMGTHIVLDEDTPDLAGLTIQGTLSFDNQDLNLTADMITVMGTFQIGAAGAGNQYMHQATITLNGSGASERGIMVIGGTLELHGNPTAVSYTKINAHAPAGSTNLSLIEHVDWQVGQEIIVSPTDFYLAGNGISETQKVNLTNISGSNIDFNTALNAHRWGVLQYATNTGVSLSNTNIVTPPSGTGTTPTILDERAYVANLTRNIVIQAPDDALWNTNGFGVHLMVMRAGGGTGAMGIAHVDGVEFRRAGQRGQLGRYPFHWHMISYNGSDELGDATGQYIRNSSINTSENRGIVIHGTNGVTVQNNVVYDIKGHGIFTEDASERRNIIDGNIVLHVRHPAAADLLKFHEGDPFTGRGASGFWISNPDNTVSNNVAGDNQSNGFWLAFPTNPWGLSIDVPIIPQRLLFGVFDNNVAFSNGSEGILLDWAEIDNDGNISPDSYIPTTDGQDPQWPFPFVSRFTLNQCDVWKNNHNGLWDRSLYADTYEFVNADNCGLFFAGAGDYGNIERCLAIGTSHNHLMNGTGRPIYPNQGIPVAFATYHSTFDIKNNIAMDFSEADDITSGAFSTEDYYIRPVEKGQIRNGNNLLINTHPGVKLVAEEPHFTLASALWDPHGVWGGTPGDYLVYDRPFFTYGKDVTTIAPNTDISGGVLVEGPFYGVYDFVINHANDRWLDYMELNVERLDDDFDVVDTWVVDEAQPNWQLAHMRDFATSPDAYYKLEFPTIPEVYDVGASITCMTTADDYQVLAIEYSGNYTIDQIFTTTIYHYLDDPAVNAPASGDKHIYQQVGCLADVLDSATGEVYWQDSENDLVWMKIRGGVDQGWNPGDYPSDHDLELYWEFYLRMTGSVGTAVAPDLFLSENRIAILPNPTDNIFEIQGLLGDYTIEILDASGNVYQSLNTTNSSLEIDITSLPAGLYFISVENNSNNLLQVEKILKM